MSSGLETLGLWLLGTLWNELVQLGESWLRLLSRLVVANGHALDSLANPLVLWLILLSAVAARLLVSVPARPRTQRPMGRTR